MTYDQWKTASPYDEITDVLMQELEEKLKELSPKKNLGSCFDIYAFGCKYADLEPDGCTGIKFLEYPDEDNIIINVGGHKTVVPPNCEWAGWQGIEATDEQIDSWMEVAQEIVCGAGSNGYWSGDDWFMTVEDSDKVEWVFDDDGEYDIDKTANLVIKTAEDMLKSWQDEMILLSKMMDHIRQGKYNL